MNRDSLTDWLAWQEALHWQKIDFGLDRLLRVYQRLDLPQLPCPVITIGGTNGKGSCVALLASMLRSGGYRVGTFTSPHLRRYNERIQIDARQIDDTSLIAAFERIDAARHGETLTYFEFNTLAALLIFQTACPDVVILEVGMGGRLDTVNIVDADVAVISSIALDHCEYLGNDVEAIGREKAGIFRAHQTAIFGARDMPSSIAEVAREQGTTLRCLGVQFEYSQQAGVWTWRGLASERRDLPPPALLGDVQYDNAATALAALEALQRRLPVSDSAVAAGLRNVQLPGRFQILRDARLAWIFDVAHNPAASRTLATRLAAGSSGGQTWAVCGIVADKDIEGVVRELVPHVQHWIVAALDSPRALAAGELAARIVRAGANVVATADSVAAACEEARRRALPGDRVLVFGSFSTVGPGLEWAERSLGAATSPSS